MFVIFLPLIEQILISVLLVTVDYIEISIIRSCCDYFSEVAANIVSP